MGNQRRQRSLYFLLSNRIFVHVELVLSPLMLLHTHEFHDYTPTLPTTGRGQLQVNEELINPSIDNWRTRWYDKYQLCCLGIL